MRQHEHVYEALLEPLTAAYGLPAKPDYLEAFYRQWALLLHKYNRAELETARERVLGTFRKVPFKPWPDLPDCVAACEDARAAAVHREQLNLSASSRVLSWVERERLRREDEAAWSDEAKMEANLLVQSSLGRLAAAQGWILGLHDFCRRHRRLPDPVKESKAIAEMKANAKYFDDVFDTCSGALRRTAEIMRAKRGKLRELVMQEDQSC